MLSKFSRVVCDLGSQDFDSLDLAFSRTWFGLGFLNSNVSYLAFREFGLGYRGSLNFVNFQNSFLYLCGVENFHYTDTNSIFSNFIVYQGHTGDSVALLADVVFPGLTFIEKESSFLNMESKVQKTFPLKLLSFSSQIDWKIVNALKLFFYRHSTFIEFEGFVEYENEDDDDFEPITSEKIMESCSFFTNMSQIHRKLYLLTPCLKEPLQYYSNFSKFADNIILKFRDAYLVPWSSFSPFRSLFFFQNRIIVSNKENFFNTNILTRVSKILSLSSNRFKLNQVNFVN